MTTPTPGESPSPSAIPPASDPGSPPRRSRGRRIRNALFWSLLLLVSALAGLLGFAYAYVTDSETLARLIRAESPRYFPGTALEIGRVRVRPLLGEISLERVRLNQPLASGDGIATVQTDYLSIKHDLQALARGEFHPREVVMVKPVLRLRRRPDGRWNLEGLLADPWPAPPLETTPTIQIRDGTVELHDGPPEQPPVMVLRDVSLKIRPGAAGQPLAVEGTARGGPFDQVRFEGTYDRPSGRLVLVRGDLTRLALSESLCRCLPDDELRAAFRGLGLSGGEVDLTLKSFVYDPDSPQPVRYGVGIRLRGGSLQREDLPFAISGLEAVAAIEDGTLHLVSAEGRNGKTLLAVQGRLSATDPTSGPLDLTISATDLELDDRLRAATPAEYAPFWEEFRPSGWINAAARLVRARTGGPIGFGLSVSCRDVAIEYFKFPYPLQHIRGNIVWQGSKIDLDLHSVIGGAPVTGQGTIRDPGDNAIVDLEFQAGAMPVDGALLKAMPPEVAQVVREFEPRGSARGVVHFQRRPPGSPEIHPKADDDGVYMHAELDLNPGFSIRWVGMPYLVDNLTGHLDLRPDRWAFQGMTGHNGPATLRADGEVLHVGPGDPAVTLTVTADRLPFDQQLRDSLPPEWRQTWETLNPSGFSRVEARISTGPDRLPHYHLKLIPEPAETRVRLVLTPVILGSDGRPTAGPTLNLPPMENVSGTFVFDDGTVTMSDVKCVFREAPVSCKAGTVVLRDTGAFELAVTDLLVTKLRLDAELRKIMPPVMAEFARKLDDGRTFWLRGDMRIDWSGEAGRPALCRWRNGVVVFNGNTIQTGLPLEHLQGELRDVAGESDGQSLTVEGFLDLASIRLQGQQITALRTPLVVDRGWARFDDIQAEVLGGRILGRVAVSLDTTPRFEARLELNDADLSRYTMTLPGKQDLRGKVHARLDLGGEGNDLRTVSGSGWARVTQGDLGKLPMALRWTKVTNFRPPTRTAFDAVEIGVTLSDGEALLDPIKLTGDAFSLAGSGTVRLLGDQEVNLRLRPLYGRSERPLPLVGNAMREATGRVMDFHVTGPLASPRVDPEPLPDVFTRASETFRRLAERERDERGGDRLQEWERGRARLWDRPRDSRRDDATRPMLFEGIAPNRPAAGASSPTAPGPFSPPGASIPPASDGVPRASAIELLRPLGRDRPL